jgi:hypothetical protein
MNPELEETIYVDFITSSPTTGAATDADSLPTCDVFEDSTDTAILTPTVTKRTGKTGNYRVPIVCTAANGFEATKSYNIVVAATCGGVAAKAVVQTFQMRTNGPDDLAASILTRATQANVATELANVGLTTTVTGRIDAAISTRSTYAGADTSGTTTLLSRVPTTAASQTSVDTIDDFLDTEVAAIKAKTDQLQFAGTDVKATLDGETVSISAADLLNIADAILKRDMSVITGESARSLLNALRFLRNKWSVAGTTLTVTKEDDTTTAWTASVTKDATSAPVVASDPA